MVLTSPSPNSNADPIPETTPPLARSAAIGFYALAVLFNLCLVAQLVTVGLAVFYDPAWWNAHVWLVRSYSGLSLILLLWVYWQPFPPRTRTLTLSFPVVLGLQFLTIHLQTPLPLPLAVMHPLLGFALFTASTTLVHRVWHLVSIPSETREPQPKTPNPL
ncbi:DUF6220 domain-containing protein [Nodosilinea nodulosa]|uniref:DUF6220 domain-containing protein n=1 Tax=Nodosilinea nodulosa TaxID=416001 RepID=UPI001CEC93C9|nr:DUF6220 domain-containing protein [Nodosilinea nodulosa]